MNEALRLTPVDGEASLVLARLRAALLELSSAFPGDRELQLQAGRDLLAAGFPDDAARQLRVIDERFADPGRAPVLLARAEFAGRHSPDSGTGGTDVR